jgi:hypothetical protein
MGAQGSPLPALQFKENMYGDAIVDLASAEAAASVKAEEDLEESSAAGAMRKTGSWQLTNNKEGHGMHVTFQVVMVFTNSDLKYSG